MGRTRTGPSAPAIAQFGAGFAGEVLLRGDPGYDSASTSAWWP
jgi:hypothetical protein